MFWKNLSSDERKERTHLVTLQLLGAVLFSIVSFGASLLYFIHHLVVSTEAYHAANEVSKIIIAENQKKLLANDERQDMLLVKHETWLQILTEDRHIPKN